MKTATLLVLILASGLLQAQTFAWADQIGGTLEDVSNSLTTDAGGNVYTTGRFAGTMDADPGPGVLNLTSAGGNDIYISKVNASGNLVWAKQIGGVLSDEGTSLAVGATGNLYITGTFTGTVDFDLGAGEFLMTAHLPYAESCPQAPDLFILKLNASGEFAWAGQVGGNGRERSRAIALTAEENVVVAGEYASEGNFPVDLDPTGGTNFVTSTSGAAAFMIKLDPDGAFTWAKQWYSSGLSAGGCGLRDALVHPFSLYTDVAGSIFCTGDFGSTVDFDPDQGINSIGTQSNAAFVMKLNSDGGFQWARALNNSGNHAYGKDVVVGSNGNVYSAGAFDGTIDFDPGTGTKNLKAPGSPGPSGIGPSDAYVWILNSSGNYVWAGQLGGNTSDAASSIDLDGAGNMYITGTFTGTADFHPGTPKITLKSAGGNDVFISNLTISGGYVWAGRIGGTSNEYANALDIDASGAILTTGTFQGTADFDPAAGTYNLATFGGQDMFIQKMTQGGGGNLARPWNDEIEVLEANVFPNPTTDVLNVDFGENIENSHVQIYNLNGQLMLNKIHVAGRRISVDVSGIPAGSYIISLRDDVKAAVFPFVKTD